MSGTPDDIDDFDEDDVRPFLQARTPLTTQESDGDHDDGLRPYALTGGRTGAGLSLGFETNVLSTEDGYDAQDYERAERLAILELAADEPLSIAELSVFLNLPIGVVRVLASDLIEEGLLMSSNDSYSSNLKPHEDISLIRQVIAGVRAL
jgi:Protein of unknown function (DUF742)